MKAFDVAIVGGGPAGLAAAERTLRAGLSTCIVDEQQRPGGQILRQPPSAFSVPGWLSGALYRQGRALLDRVSGDEGLHWLGGQSVLGIEREGGGFRLTLLAVAGGVSQIRASRVLVAGGCYDMPVAFPGWTLPGVMSAGAVQTLIKAQQILPGQRIVLAGTHPLMLVLARQIVDAGGRVAAICFAQPPGHMLRSMLGSLPRAARTPVPLLVGLSDMAALRRAAVPIRFGTRLVRAEADAGGAGVAGVALKGRHGEESMSCDLLATCYGFMPQADLVRQAGAQVRWSLPAGGWEAIHDDAMRSTVPGLYVAGETTGVAGSDAAMAEGAIAGLSMAEDAGALTEAQARKARRSSVSRRRALQAFVDLLRRLADPRGWLPEAGAETILCRCEDVTAGEVDEAIAQAGQLGNAFGAGAIKLRCRAGMGLCQGRTCEHALVRRIAVARACSEADVEGFRVRYPVRPIAISDLLAGEE